MRPCTRVLALLCSIVAATCTRGQPSKAALMPVALPDLSAAAPSVQRQLQEEYAALPGRTTGAIAPDDRAAAYGHMGVLLMAAEFRQAAIPYLVNAQRLAPRDSRWPYYLAHLNRLENRLPEAAALFEQARQLQADHVPTLVWLGAVDLDLGRVESARAALTQAVSLGPQSAAAFYWLGRVELAQGELKAAADHLERALALDGGRSRIQYQLATVYRRLGDTARADRLARESGQREIEPNDPLMKELGTVLNSAMAYEERGQQALDAGQLAEASANYRKAAELEPANPSPREHLGTVLFVQGDPAGAEQQFREAIRLQPTFARAHYSLGVLFGSRGRNADAVRELTEAVKSDPTYMQAHVALGDLLRTTGRAKDALAEYDAALALLPKEPSASLGAAMALVALGRDREARERLTAALASFPDQRELGHATARLAAASHDRDVRAPGQALTMMRERLQVEPRTVGIAEAMAMAFAANGDFGEAVQWEQLAVSGAERAHLTLLARMSATLQSYERHEPPRSPWSPTDDLRSLAEVPLE
jgi:tetratricopeptide (TPR) repeat protein